MQIVTPVSTSTSASDYATSTSAGYTIISTSSPADSVSIITQTAPLSFPIGGTVRTILPIKELPTEAAPYTTSSVPAYPSESGILPKEPVLTPAVIVLPYTGINKDFAGASKTHDLFPMNTLFYSPLDSRETETSHQRHTDHTPFRFPYVATTFSLVFICFLCDYWVSSELQCSLRVICGRMRNLE